MIGYAPFLGQVRMLGQATQETNPSRLVGQPSKEEQDAYYRKLAQYFATASDLSKFVSEHRDIAKEFNLDKDDLAFADKVGGFNAIKWGAVAGTLREGGATYAVFKDVDDLGALAEPAQRRLMEAQKVAAQQATASPSTANVILTVGGIGIVILAVTEAFGVTNILGLRK